MYISTVRKIILFYVLLCSIIRADLINPELSDTLFSIYVLFEWEQEPYATNYNLQVSISELFDEIIFDINDSTLLYLDKVNMEWENTYYWRVRPIYENGDYGPWIDTYSFYIDNKINDFINVQTLNSDLIQNGITIIGDWYRKNSIVVDQEGKEIWNSGNIKFSLRTMNKYGEMYGIGDIGETINSGIKFNFYNEILWNLPGINLDQHEFIELPNGNFMSFVKESEFGPIPLGDWTPLFQNLGFQADGVTNEFEWFTQRLVEWERDTNEEIWSWSLFDNYTMHDFDYLGGTWTNALTNLRYDWTHSNSIFYNDQENAIYRSDRHLSRITKIDYPSGEIIAMLGLPSDFIFSGNCHICTDLRFSWQHHLQILDNGNLLFFDNGNLSKDVRDIEFSTSRILEVEIIDNSYCSIIWSYELPQNLFSYAMGSVQKLNNGNYLISTLGDNGHIIEVTPDYEIIWDASLNNDQQSENSKNYRAFRIPSMYPNAFSVIFSNLVIINLFDNLTQSILLTEKNDSFSLTVYNENGYEQDYYYTLSADNSFFNNQVGIISIEPYGDEVLTFKADNISNIITKLNFEITPKYHEYFQKNFNFIVSLTPKTFTIIRAYPNPFNSIINIDFYVTKLSEIKLSIYNLKGQLINVMTEKEYEPGWNKIFWDAENYSSGIYIVKIKSGDFVQTQKVMLVK